MTFLTKLCGFISVMSCVLVTACTARQGADTGPTKDTGMATQATTASTLASSRENSDQASAVSVANLSEARAPLDLRRKSDLHWDAATQGLELFNRDTLRSGENGYGLVMFKDRSQLVISANSTVTIQDHSQKEGRSRTVVALPKGVVTGDLAEESDLQVELTVKTRKGWVRVKNYDESGKKVKGKIKAAVLPTGDTEVAVESGQATFLTQGKEQPLKSGEQINVKAEVGEAPPSEGGSGIGIGAESIGDELPVVKESQVIVKPIVLATTTTLASVAKLPAPVLSSRSSFEIISPKSRSKVAHEEIKIKVKVKGAQKVILNGNDVPNLKPGVNEIPYTLKLGLNLLVFQIVDEKSETVKNISYEIIRTQ